MIVGVKHLEYFICWVVVVCLELELCFPCLRKINLSNYIYIYYNTLYSQPFVDTALVAYPYDPYGTLENHGSPVMFHLETMEAWPQPFDSSLAKPGPEEMRSTSDGGQGQVLRLFRSFCSVNGEGCDRWNSTVPGFAGVSDGFKATSFEERWQTHPASRWLAFDTAQSIAGARHCGLRFLALTFQQIFMLHVYCPRFTSLSGRACIRGYHADSRCNNLKVSAPPSHLPQSLETLPSRLQS